MIRSDMRKTTGVHLCGVERSREMGKQKFWRSFKGGREHFSRRVQTRNDYYKLSSNPLLIKLFERGKIGFLAAQQLAFSREEKQERKQL